MSNRLLEEFNPDKKKLIAIKNTKAQGITFR